MCGEMNPAISKIQNHWSTHGGVLKTQRNVYRVHVYHLMLVNTHDAYIKNTLISSRKSFNTRHDIVFEVYSKLTGWKKNPLCGYPVSMMRIMNHTWNDMRRVTKTTRGRCYIWFLANPRMIRERVFENNIMMISFVKAFNTHIADVYEFFGSRVGRKSCSSWRYPDHVERIVNSDGMNEWMLWSLISFFVKFVTLSASMIKC